MEIEFIREANAPLRSELDADYAALGARLARDGVEIDSITDAVAHFHVALPSWGVGTGGTRFARFPGPGEPSNVFDKLDDCAVVNRLSGATPTVSLHFPWDRPSDPAALRQYADTLGLGFDAVNSNTFQDRPGSVHSYKFGSLTHTDPAVREQAIEHNLECISLGQMLGSKALTVWIGDGANFPGQSHIARAFERYLASASKIYAGLPDDWTMFLEHKLYEPAFYATVIQDWGSSLMAAQFLGPKAMCLVDLGHHAPNVNIEMIVARLIHVGRLGGFHFNDSKYGDDDLDAGSIDPYRLFLIFNELADGAWRKVPNLRPAHMLDQSHNVTDPIESLVTSAAELLHRRSSARSRPTFGPFSRRPGDSPALPSILWQPIDRADIARLARRRGNKAAAPAVESFSANCEAWLCRDDHRVAENFKSAWSPQLGSCARQRY
jgi:L-rhamnose isomerase/sugar isomerase